jgi:hypothetical protein
MARAYNVIDADGHIRIGTGSFSSVRAFFANVSF